MELNENAFLKIHKEWYEKIEPTPPLELLEMTKQHLNRYNLTVESFYILIKERADSILNSLPKSNGNIIDPEGGKIKIVESYYSDLAFLIGLDNEFKQKIKNSPNKDEYM